MSKTLYFNVKAGLKSIIGKDLIPDDITAIFELVKNGYDAGAKRIAVRFLGIGTKGAKIIIEDDGKGMSAAEIKEKWLSVGYSQKSKRHQLGKRIVAGSKGIGRFSCDRLGSELKLYSKSRSDTSANQVTVNWNAFDKNTKRNFLKVGLRFERLSELPSYEEGTNHSMEWGTILEIGALRAEWDKKRIEDTEKHLSRLLNPFSNDFSEFEIRIHAPQFEIKKTIDNSLFEDLSTIYTKVTVDANGGIERLLVDKEDLVDHLVLPATQGSKLLKNTRLTLYCLDIGAKVRFAKRMGVPLVRYGSIFLYRNGFRILPYGEPGDDWLGIDKRHAQGIFRTLGLRDTVGFVDIRLPEMKGFADVSSRKGLNEAGPEFQELRNFIIAQFLLLESYVKQTWKPSESEDFERHTAYKHIEEATKQIKDKELRKFVGENLKRIKAISTKEKKTIQALKRENLFLKSTATTSPEAKNLIHTMKISSRIIVDDVNEMVRLVSKLENAAELMSFLESIRLHAQMIQMSSRIATRANFDLTVDQVDDKDIVKYMVEYIDSFRNTISRRIEVTTNVEVDGFITSFPPLAVSIIVDNLIDNSYKNDATRIKFTFSKKANSLVIVAEDDGNGVAEDFADRIFELGFTTTKGGSGLGLYHIKEIVGELNGSVAYAGKGLGKSGAAFKIILRRKNGN